MYNYFHVFSEFTPKLVDWYNRIKKGPNGDRLNIVFVSSDFDDESWRDYCAEMPWYALDFKDRDKEVGCVYYSYIYNLVYTLL